jgi:hypothetical protein
MGAPNIPLVSQDSTEFPMHLLSCPTHSTHEPCEQDGMDPVHVTWLDQEPVASQLWVTFPAH